jgi:hypothetical protein
VATWALAIAMTLYLFFTFAIWTATSWIEFPRFLFAVGILFILPGSQLIRWGQLQVSPLEHILLSAVLGMIATCSLYCAAAWLGRPLFLWFWIFVVFVGFAWNGRTFLIGFWNNCKSVQRSHFFLLLAVFVSWLPLYQLNYFYRNLAGTADGALTHAIGQHEIVQHISLAAELTHTFPPQVPFLAGQSLNYNLGMDIVTAVLSHYGGLAIVDLVVRFCPTMFITIDLLAVFCLARRFVGSGEAGVAAAALAVLGEDFSFVPGILQRSGNIWSGLYFRAPTVIQLYTGNTMVAAHGLLFTSLLSLQHSLADRRWRWVVTASICSAALLQTKIFMFVQLLIALVFVSAIYLVWLRRSIFLKEMIATLLVASPLIFLTFIANRHGAEMVWRWSSGLEYYVKHAFRASDWPTLVSHPVLGLVAYLALTFGFRIVGFGRLIDSFRLSKYRPFHLLLAFFVVLGPVLTLTSKIVPSGSPESYNNSIWFMLGSKYVATLFAVDALAGIWRSINWVSRSLMLFVVAAISLGSTIQFVYKRSLPADEFKSPVMASIDFLNREARAGQVVLSALNEPILLLTKLRVPLYKDLWPDWLGSSEIATSRREDIEDFWRSWDSGVVRGDVLSRYAVDWVVSRRLDTPNELSEPWQILVGKLQIERVFKDSEFIVYRVDRPAAPAG